MIYISDLDGTLLDSSGNLSEKTIFTVRRFIRNGGRFTIATARSVFSSASLVEQLGLRMPVILRNGAMIYDPVNMREIDKKTMSCDEVRPIIEYFLEKGLHPIIHHIENGILRVDYTGIHNYGEEHYFEARKKERDKRLRLVDNYDNHSCDECISVCVIDDNEKLREIHQDLHRGAGKDFVLHRYIDNYSDHTWFEVNHHDATKAAAAKKLLELTGEKEYIAFGDNVNDIEMLENAREAYVPENSYLAWDKYGFKEIKSNDESGVALHIEKVMGF